MVVFKLTNISKQFGDLQALSGIDLQIRSGEQVALAGPSGAGKSTLLGVLNGTIRPSGGELEVLGQNLARLSSRALQQLQRQVGTVYQQFHLVDNLRVIHNVNAGHLGRWPLWKALASLFWPLETATVYRALEQVGIPEKLYERTGQLSGGQQQRVALARVLVQNPTVILADEPISNVDPERSREIMNLLHDLSQEMGKTLVVSLHAIDFALSHFDRIVGLREGCMLFDCPAHQVTPSMIATLYEIKKAAALNC